MKALTAAGVETITAPSSTARLAAISKSSVTSVRRSKVKVRTGLRSGPTRNTERITCSVKRSSGAGTTCMRSCEPSARTSARSGEMTVVLPSPMSI